MSTSKFCKPEVKSHRCVQVASHTPLTEKEKEAKEEKKWKPPQTRNFILQGKQTTEYCDLDGLKVMLLPSKEPNYYPLTISVDELNRLQSKAVVVTEKDRLKSMEEAKAEQTRLAHESALRKNELKQFDVKGKMECKGQKLSALEREARDKANYLLKRAWELRKEEEDDVKKTNSLILQAKCQAIRDAQLVERKLIEKEIRQEEKRLEQLMDDERVRLMEMEKKRMEVEQAKKEAYVRELNQQKEEMEAHRLLNAEFLIEERRKTNEAMFVIMLEELEEFNKAKDEKRKMREALNLANAEMRRMQAIEQEEERVADLRILEYMKMKTEREERLEREKEAEKRNREIGCARQRDQQQKQADLQATQEEMSCIRRQEEYEREWRRKEKEAAKKKIKMEEDCRLARDQQIRDNRRIQAMEIARDKQEYERNLKIQLEIQEKERLLDLKRKHTAVVYREQILQQINSKEKQRIEERQEKFQEGIGLKAEEAKKKSELKQILHQKVEELRQHNVPEFYISEIRRQLKLN